MCTRAPLHCFTWTLHGAAQLTAYQTSAWCLPVPSGKRRALHLSWACWQYCWSALHKGCLLAGSLDDCSIPELHACYVDGKPLQHLLPAAVLLIASLATIIAFYRTRPLAGLLMMPYLGWTCFATTLINCSLLYSNPAMLSDAERIVQVRSALSCALAASSMFGRDTA